MSSTQAVYGGLINKFGKNFNALDQERKVLPIQYSAKIISISPLIEEEVTLEIHGLQIVAFVNVCPFELLVGELYQIDLDVTILDEFIIKLADLEERRIDQIDDSFAYTLQGKLDIDRELLDVGILFHIDSEFLMDCGYLHEQYVQIRVDRIRVDFLN